MSRPGPQRAPPRPCALACCPPPRDARLSMLSPTAHLRAVHEAVSQADRSEHCICSKVAQTSGTVAHCGHAHAWRHLHLRSRAGRGEGCAVCYRSAGQR